MSPGWIMCELSWCQNFHVNSVWRHCSGKTTINLTTLHKLRQQAKAVNSYFLITHNIIRKSPFYTLQDNVYTAISFKMCFHEFGLRRAPPGQFRQKHALPVAKRARRCHWPFPEPVARDWRSAIARVSRQNGATRQWRWHRLSRWRNLGSVELWARLEIKPRSWFAVFIQQRDRE